MYQADTNRVPVAESSESFVYTGSSGDARTDAPHLIRGVRGLQCGNRFRSALSNLQHLAAMILLFALPGCELGLDTYTDCTDHEPPAVRGGCLPSVNQAWQARQTGALPDGRVGAAVEVVTFGFVTNPRAYSWIASGAPADVVRTSDLGTVYLSGISTETNTFDPTPVDTALPPLTSPPGQDLRQERHGTALLAADILSGVPRPSQVRGQVNHEAYGQELLVGAPGDPVTQAGAVHWYYPLVEVDDTGWTERFAYGGSLTVPTGQDARVEFGSALAAGHEITSTTGGCQWSDEASWIAVGAPGVDVVYIYGVDPNGLRVGGSPPLQASPIQTLVAPGLGARFGASLVVADFNQDCIIDLAVGAPDDDWEGAVHVYPGRARGAWDQPPLEATPVTIDPDSYNHSKCEEFGYALAAGNVFSDDPELPALLIGDPKFDHGKKKDAGAVYQVAFDSNFNAKRKSFIRGGIYRSRANFGASLVLADIMTQTKFDDPSADRPWLDDLAVGIPGARGMPSTIRRAGRIAIFRAAEDGKGVAFRGPSEERPYDRSPSQMIVGDEPWAEFGSALAAKSFDAFAPAALFSGSPSAGNHHGAVSITKSLPDPFSGVWEGADSFGAPFLVDVTWDGNTLLFDMQGSAQFAMFKNGEVCHPWGTRLVWEGQFCEVSVSWPGRRFRWTQGNDYGANAEFDFDGTTFDMSLSYDSIEKTFTLKEGSYNPDGIQVDGVGWGEKCEIEPLTFMRTEEAACDR